MEEFFLGQTCIQALGFGSAKVELKMSTPQQPLFSISGVHFGGPSWGSILGVHFGGPSWGSIFGVHFWGPFFSV